MSFSLVPLVVRMDPKPAQKCAVAHETPTRSMRGTRSHARRPPAGSVDRHMPAPVAKHRLRDWHVTLSNWNDVVWVTFHALRPPPGRDVVSTWPRRSTATQKFGVGQETPSMMSPRCPKTFVFFQLDAGPVGSLEVTTKPPPTATHSCTEGQETDETGAENGITNQVDAPPAGFVDATDVGDPIPTQNETDAQLVCTDSGSDIGSAPFVQLVAPPPGSVDVWIVGRSPRSLIAKHNAADGQSSASPTGPLAGRTGWLHFSPAATALDERATEKRTAAANSRPAPEEARHGRARGTSVRDRNDLLLPPPNRITLPSAARISPAT
jgi:hypothetical protein